MNSVLKLARKIVEELNQRHVQSDGTQYRKARWREVLKEKRKNGNAWEVHKKYR